MESKSSNLAPGKAGCSVQTRTGYRTGTVGRPKLARAITLIDTRVPAGQLPGYLFYDPFLRFIHFIGPKNSARIKALEFNGIVKRHSCSSKYCEPSVEKFITSLCFYIPFIKKFCTGLES